jgi:hypothetical protein
MTASKKGFFNLVAWIQLSSLNSALATSHGYYFSVKPQFPSPRYRIVRPRAASNAR